MPTEPEGLLSKETTLSVKRSGVFTELAGLQEIPEMGGTPEKVEVTTLKNGAKRYINGVVDYGDLAFKFLYDNSSADSAYRILRQLEAARTVSDFRVELPDGTTFEFSGQATTKLDNAGVNAALKFTVMVTLNSEIVVTDPA